MEKSVKIEADFLIDGSLDGPIKNGAVVFSGTKITYVGETEHAPNADITINEKAVMPGMWDAHAHFFGVKTANPAEWLLTPPQQMAMRVAYDAKAAIEAGITGVREAGGLGLDLKFMINDGSVKGPRVYAPGTPLGTTGGHADMHSVPLKVLQAFDNPFFGTGLADGPWEAVKAVRAQLRRGADHIKIMASGGVMSQRDSPYHREFSYEETKAIVEEAKAKDRIVMAHAHGAAGMKVAVEAGVHSIEHGTWINEEIIDLMLEKGTFLVPTIYITRRLMELGPKMGALPEVIEKMKIVMKDHLNGMKLAYKKGVKIAMGTDIYSSAGPNSLVPWGENAKELENLTEIGMSPLEAIHAATFNGPLTLGPRAPKTGYLHEEYDADILVLKENPLGDIKVLQNKENILGVFILGKLEVNRGIKL